MRFVAALAFTDPGQYLEVARAADACGLYALALSDHIIVPETLGSPYPYSADGKPPFDAATPWPDPWVAIGAMAAVTTELRFMTNVYVLPARSPLVVAKTVGTAAVLSGNRVILGIGVGWMREEFAAVQQDFTNRGRRTDEAIEVLRTLWTGSMVAHEGTHYSFPPVVMVPAPTRPVPIYVGGESKPALRRAARIGDGWISTLRSHDELRDLIADLRALRGEYGRAGTEFDFVVSCTEACDLDGYRRLADLGVTTVLTMPWALYGGDPTAIETKRDALRRFGDEIIQPLR